MNWLNGKILSNTDFINQVEQIWNVKLPSDFKSIVLEYNRGYPEKNSFDTTDTKGRVFGELLNFELVEKNNVLRHHQIVKGKPSNQIFPFMIDPGGNYTCFNYEVNKFEPTVIFWNHEGLIVNNEEVHKIEFVANTYTEFLSKLYKSEILDEESDFSGFTMLD
jgi:hypothetical protein